MSKPEAGQWWVDNEAVPGDSADDVAARIAIVLPDKKLYVETSRGVYDVWTHVNENVWHHEPLCTGWDWVVPKPQPAEDPDEWVIQDRVPVRVGIDMISWHGDVPHEYMIPPTKDGASSGKMHGAAHPWNANEKLRVWCRRRDLPKVEQAEQWPKYYTGTVPGTAYVKRLSPRECVVVETDGTETAPMRWADWDERKRTEITEAEALALLKNPKQCAVGCHGPRCPNPALPGKDYCSKCADWSYHEKQKPQPKKTMLRLWIDPDCNIHAGLKNDRDLELHYDHETRQFYTENQS